MYIHAISVRAFSFTVYFIRGELLVTRTGPIVKIPQASKKSVVGNRSNLESAGSVGKENKTVVDFQSWPLARSPSPISLSRKFDRQGGKMTTRKCLCWGEPQIWYRLKVLHARIAKVVRISDLKYEAQLRQCRKNDGPHWELRHKEARNDWRCHLTYSTRLQALLFFLATEHFDLKEMVAVFSIARHHIVLLLQPAFSWTASNCWCHATSYHGIHLWLPPAWSNCPCRLKLGKELYNQLILCFGLPVPWKSECQEAISTILAKVLKR